MPGKVSKARPYPETMDHNARIAAADRAYALMTEAHALLASAGLLDLPSRPLRTSAACDPTVGSCVEASMAACADTSAALERQRPTIHKGDPVNIVNRWGQHPPYVATLLNVTRAWIHVAVNGRAQKFPLNGLDNNDAIDPDDLARILRDLGPKR